MAGVYGEINSRADFHRVLGEATATVRGMLAASPRNPVMERIQKQLQAMARWTENRREPTESERRNIDVSLIAARELAEDGETGKLAERLSCLNNYFEDWPTDEEARSATDDDFFEDE